MNLGGIIEGIVRGTFKVLGGLISNGYHAIKMHRVYSRGRKGLK